MRLNLIDKLGEWNPQLFRELKGRLKVFPIAIASLTSLLLQVIVCLYQLREFPGEKYSITDTYCLLSKGYLDKQNYLYQQQSLLNQQLSHYQQITTSNPEIISNLNKQLQQVSTAIEQSRESLEKNFCPIENINFSLWWREHWQYIFLSFSVIFVFTLLVGGVYLLISDLAREEKRGTLNFIRLSPQSETNILTGKILGVPSLIYLFVLLAIPLHIWAGISAKITLSSIVSYYAVLIASCAFFYNSALLFTLLSNCFNSFQPWLGSGAVLLFLFITMSMTSSYNDNLNNATAWLRLLSPWDITSYLFPSLFNKSPGWPLSNLQFFYFPIGKSVSGVVVFHLLNYGICSYGIWQVLKRAFRNPNASVLNKGQSYMLTAFVQVICLGFTMQEAKDNIFLKTHISILGVYNFIIILSLIFLLSSPRQNIQDWARYRHQNDRHMSLLEELIWGEKSPALLAIAINLIIASIPVLFWVVITPEQINIADFSRVKGFLAIGFAFSLMMICATITQLILLIKNSKRYVWAFGTVGVTMLLPPVILLILNINSWQYPVVWLFSTYPWAGIEGSKTITMFMALLSQLVVLTLLNFRLTRQIKLVGESATKALLAGR